MSILKCLREEAKYSQEYLASQLNITRQTYIKYEKEEVSLPLDVVKKLSNFYRIDYSCIIDNELPTEYKYDVEKKEDKKVEANFRISIPQENYNKFKQVFLYLINKIGSKPNVGQTVLYKLLYFIDFDYYEMYEEQLIGAKYQKNHFGPTPISFNYIVSEMADDEEVEIVRTKYFNNDQTKYLPIKKPDLNCLSAREMQHIKDIIRKHSDKTANQLSEFSHKDVPWITAEKNGLIDYEAVFYRTEETSVREYAND